MIVKKWLIKNKWLIWIVYAIIAFVVGLYFKKVVFPDFATKLTFAKIEFENDVYDFGLVPFLSDAQKYFKYKNIGYEELVIHEIITSCGCIWSQQNTIPLLPEKQDSLLIIYDSSIKGFFTKEIIIISNSTTSPDHIFIMGTIQQE